MKSLQCFLVLLVTGALVGYVVDTSYYHPALMKFFNENVGELIEGLKYVKEQEDSESQPALVTICEEKFAACECHADTDACKRVVCMKNFGSCLKNDLSSEPSYTPPPKMSPCLEKTNTCFHLAQGDCTKKLECTVCSKYCMDESPNPPSYCASF